MLAAALVHADPLGLLVAFAGGMLSFLSPCVLPLVPGYVSMVSGLSAAELRSVSPPSRARSRVIRGILLFIAGFTVVFVVLGAGSSALGQMLVAHRQLFGTVSGSLIVAFGCILVAMSAGIRLPQALAGERRIVVRPAVLGAWAPPVMGIAFAFAWTPCVGPVLGSVLAIAAGTGRGTPAGGIALLLAYSLGLGVPFLLSGLAFGRMTDLLARFRGHLRMVDLVAGVVLVLFGVLLMTGNVDVISAHMSTWLRDLHLARLTTS